MVTKNPEIILSIIWVISMYRYIIHPQNASDEKLCMIAGDGAPRWRGGRASTAAAAVLRVRLSPPYLSRPPPDAHVRRASHSPHRSVIALCRPSENKLTRLTTLFISLFEVWDALRNCASDRPVFSSDIYMNIKNSKLLNTFL